MIAFICYFLPAVLSLWLFETLTKKQFILERMSLPFL